MSYCNGMSERGGRMSTIYALRRRGLLDGDRITAEGLAAINCKLPPNANMRGEPRDKPNSP